MLLPSLQRGLARFYEEQGPTSRPFVDHYRPTLEALAFVNQSTAIPLREVFRLALLVNPCGGIKIAGTGATMTVQPINPAS
jgi:hypothetical protein